MSPEKSFAALRKALSARIVYGQPIERDGVTVIPAATVIGGGGLGVSDTSPDGHVAAGGGGGYGLIAWPAGAIEIRGDKVRWRRTIDLTWLYLTALFVLSAVVRALLERP